MPDDRQPTHVARRDLLKGAGALAGAATLGLVPGGVRAQSPKRGGVLRFATRTDSSRLDPHRYFVYYVSNPLAATTYGLLDITDRMEVVPGVAESWEGSKDLLTYTFRLRRGMEYHNGRTIDAESVKWNFERIMNPRIGNSFTRSALVNLKEVKVLDKLTVRCVLKEPSAVFPSNVIYYPVNLIAPDSAEQADTHPIGCGPFKFKSWKRFDTTELVRFENWWETDARGNPLPYLDGIVGLPRKEDRVRLTALRTGEAHLIDNMAYSDAAVFPSKYGDAFNTWPVPQVGTSWIGFNLKKGVFSYDNPNGHMVRQAAAHAIDHQAIHEAVFNGQGAIARGFYSEHSPWYTPDIRSWPEYDPDKARALLRKAGAVGARVTILSRQAYPYMHQTGELVHAMWTDVGFKATHEIHPNSVIRDKRRKNEYDAESSANSYRLDPDGWFSRSVLSSSANTKDRTGYNNPEADRLVIEARRTADRARRLELYAQVENIVNTDLPYIYSHFVPLLEAASKKVRGYHPAFAGPYSWQRGGIRTTWLA